MKIDPFKMKVTPAQSEIIQKILFKNGYKWADDRNIVQYTSQHNLFLDVDDYMRYASNDRDYVRSGNKEFKYDEFILKYSFKFGK